MGDGCPKECDQHLRNIDKSITSIKKTTYGDDGMTGLAGTTVKKTHLWVVTLGMLTIVASFVLYGLGSFAGEKEKRADNTAKIAGVKEQVKAVKEKLNAVAKIQIQVVKTQTEIIQTVRRIESDQVTKTDLIEVVKTATKAATKAAIKESKDP